MFLCVVLESDLVSFFYKWWPVFPAPLVKEIVFAPLYILASFVKDKVSIGVWIYLWAFYFVPLICISVFVPVPYWLDDCGSVVEPEVRQIDSSSSILLSQDETGAYYTEWSKPERKMKLEESTCLTSDYTTKPQSSRQYGTGTKTEIQINGTK